MSIFKDLEHIESSFTTCKQHKTGISDAFLALLKVLTRQENFKIKEEGKRCICRTNAAQDRKLNETNTCILIIVTHLKFILH